MLRLLEKLRTRTDNVIRMYYDKPIVEQINAIKKTTGVGTHLSIMLHKHSIENSWNPLSYKQLSEEIDKSYRFTRDSYKNIEDIVFNYLDGWIQQEDLFWVFYTDYGDDYYLDPTDGADKLQITYLLTQKIKSIFPLDENQAFEIVNDFVNYKVDEEGLENLGEPLGGLMEEKGLNPKVKPGDHIRVISVDLNTFPPSEYEEQYMPPDHLELGKVLAVYQDENPLDGAEVTMLRVYFPELEIFLDRDGGTERMDDGIRILALPYDKYVKTDEVLTESGVIGGNNPNKPRIADSMRKNLIRARFERPGGWGRPSQVFVLYMTPTGKIMDIQFGGQTNTSVSPFKINQQVSFGDLYGFEQNSKFDLRMFGRLREQDEQISLFPTGEWEFPVGFEDFKQENGEIIAGSDQDTADWIRKSVPERVVSKIFKMWDTNGIDFSNFKLLGLPDNSTLITFMLKRYIRNTKKPIPVEYIFDCDELTELFDTDSRDYNLDYIRQYLCGDDSFWDYDFYYTNEWSDYMSDDIDEANWKIISEIFGGVSKSDAQDILDRSSSSEKIDELIEKYDEEIDEIRNFVTSSHDTAMEDATKNAMAKDIKEKILDHFGDTRQHAGKIQGKLFRNDNGKFNYVIEGDLRDLVNDVWDNTEDVFEFHPDYTNTTLEDALMEMDGRTMVSYDLEYHLFRLLMEEEFKFWDYCEGRLGECLQVETKFFDGYWSPTYDVNEYLSDRLYELTPGPVQEGQSIWGNGVMDREKEWCEDDENWLCNTGSENLGFSDLYIDDGHDIIHNFPGNVHLSDLSPEEKETRIPNSEKKKKYKKVKLNPDLSVGPFNVPVLTEQEKKSRFKTIYENNNWKYVWPIGDESFCEIAKGTKWCEEWTKDKNWYQSISSSGTHYILIDKKTGEKYSLVDQEKVPGMPSYKVRIYNKDREFLNTHRFLADKPTLHELFNQSYTMLDKLRYNVEIPKEDLDNFYKETVEKDGGDGGVDTDSGKLLDLVYKIIKNPTLEGLKQQLEENYNGGLTILTEDDNPVLNSMIAGKQFLSIYLEDSEFKENWMNLSDDDDYYFDLAVDRYYSDDHCEEMEEDEIAYIGSYLNEENIKKLNNLSEIIGEPIGDWRQESEIDEYLTKYFTKDWNDYIWRIIEQIGCAVGRNRVKDITKIVKEELLLDVDYVGGRNYPLWRIDITYPELLYLVGIYGVDNIKQLEDHSINELDGNLYDAWWDSWSLEGGEEDINWEMGRFLDNVMEEYGDELKTLGENEEKFVETINNLGFTKPYREWQLKQDVEGSSYQRSIIIKDWDLKSGKIHIQIQENDEQGRWQTKQYQTTIDELPTYVTQQQLFESIE